MSDFKKKITTPKYDLRKFDPLKRVDFSYQNDRERGDEMKNNNRSYNIPSDNVIQTDLHDRIFMMKNFETSMKNGLINSNVKWEDMFKKIPLTDELLKLSDDKRKTDIYNDLLQYFFHRYETLDTYERKCFFESFPEIFEHLRKKKKEMINDNVKFAKISLKGVKSREDWKYIYDSSHSNITNPKSEYFSETNPRLNTGIISTLLSLNKDKLERDENISIGSAMGNRFEDDENYTAGIMRRTWRDLRRRYDNESPYNLDTIYNNGSRVRPEMGSEPYQHFMFHAGDIKSTEDNNMKDRKDLFVVSMQHQYDYDDEDNIMEFLNAFDSRIKKMASSNEQYRVSSDILNEFNILFSEMKEKNHDKLMLIVEDHKMKNINLDGKNEALFVKYMTNLIGINKQMRDILSNKNKE